MPPGPDGSRAPDRSLRRPGALLTAWRNLECAGRGIGLARSSR